MSVTLPNPFSRLKKGDEFVHRPEFAINKDRTHAISRCFNFEIRADHEKDKASVYARTTIGGIAVFVPVIEWGDAKFGFDAFLEDMRTDQGLSSFEFEFKKNCPVVPSVPIASFTFETEQIEELLTDYAEDEDIDVDTIDFNAAFNVIGEQFKAYHIDAEDPHTEYFYGLIERYFEEHIASKTHQP